MDYVILFALTTALICPLYFIYKRQQSGKSARGALVGNIVSFFAMCVLVTGFAIGGSASAVDPASAGSSLSTGLGYLSAALAVGMSCIGGGIAVAAGASAAMGALSENEKIFGKALIFVGLAEGVALYGLLVALMIISKI